MGQVRHFHLYTCVIIFVIIWVLAFCEGAGEKNGKTLSQQQVERCPHYEILLPVLGERPMSGPQVSNEGGLQNPTSMLGSSSNNDFAIEIDSSGEEDDSTEKWKAALEPTKSLFRQNPRAS